MKTIYAGLMLLIASSSFAQYGNLIVNGSFGSGLAGWALSHDYLYPFWKRQWDGGGENLFPANYSYSPTVWMAFNGQDGTTGVNVHSVSLYQIVNTVPGQEYRLHFYVGSFEDGSPPSSMNRLGSLDLAVLQGQHLSQSLSQFFAGYQTIPPGVSVDWQRYDNEQPGLHRVNWLAFDHDFVASSSQAVFIFQGGGFSFSIYTGLDNVSLAAVPEPGSLGIGVLGLSILIVQLLRQRAKLAHCRC